MKYTPVIGLEIHVELATKSKMFCQCEGNYFGKEPNTNVCPVCMGMPGALPVPNRQAVEWTIKIGQALNCKINKHSKFDRKHYFYPDLPKSYQISQYDEPICGKGYLDIVTAKGETKRFNITRIHLEEDTGKLTHVNAGSPTGVQIPSKHYEDATYVDFNRSSVPLVEIVTEPDFDNSEDVKIFLEELHTIIRYLDVSDADMDKGSMRLEPNISLRKPGEKGFPPYKVEVKNINSFNYAKKAIDYELPRQAEILDKGETPVQETRGYNENKGITYSQRSKEGAEDYRYFPEPDIPPMEFTDELLETIKKTIPELPAEKRKRLTDKYKIKPEYSTYFGKNITASETFEDAISLVNADPILSKIPNIAQGTASIIINKVQQPLSPTQIVDLARQTYIPKETDTGKLAEVIQTVIANNAKAVADYKGGNKNTLMFMVGQVMREMKGQADAMTVRGELEKALTS